MNKNDFLERLSTASEKAQKKQIEREKLQERLRAALRRMREKGRSK